MSRFIAFKVTRALIARFLFALHSLVSIWILYAESRKSYYWALAASPILLFVEGAVTILLRHGDEYKWFCPSVFIFLCGSVPPIWLLELKTTWKAVHNITQTANAASLVVDLKWIGYVMFELPHLPGQMWLQVVEQSLLVILILGRWLLPKGRITRDELSQLLLAYLAISADIVELFNLFQEREVRMDLKLSILVLSFWTVSLIQFPFVITTVKSQKARFCFSNPDGEPLTSEKAEVAFVEPPKSRCAIWVEKVCDVRIWGIMSTILLQDLPFWLLRIYLIFWQNVMSYTMFFFICKNSLIMWVQLYRMIIICGEPRQQPEQPKEILILTPDYYSPATSPAKSVPQTDASSGIDLRLLHVVDEEKKAEQNGSSVVAETRRPSELKITGTVDARDLVHRTARNRRNAVAGMHLRTGNLLKRKPKKSQEKQPVKVPVIKLASPDSPTDL